MSNRIRVKGGADADRLTHNLADREISYSTDNAGEGRPRRFWVTDSSAPSDEANGGDVLVGPFEFVGSSKINVDADYTTGRVVFSLIADQTFNPAVKNFDLNAGGYTTAFKTADSQGIVQTGTFPLTNPVIEVGETYGGTWNASAVNHRIQVKNDQGSNPVLIDYAFTTASDAKFDQTELQARDNIVWEDLANTATKNFNTVQATPGNFGATVVNGQVTGMAGDTVSDTLRIQPTTASGFPNVDVNRSYAWGWRVAWFVSQSSFSSETSLPTVAEINTGIANGGGHVVAYRPWERNGGQGLKLNVTTPSGQGNGWFLYIVTSTSVNSPQPGDPNDDAYGWIPHAYSSSNLPQTLTEVTNRSAGIVLQLNANQTHIGGTGLGQNNVTKFYRVWKLEVPGGWTGGQSQTVFLRDKD